MIIFDQLRISDNGKRLYINVHVNKAEYFDNIYLDKIVIMTADKVSETSPHLPTQDYIYKIEFNENYKEAHLVLTPEDFIKTWEDNPEAMRFKRSDMSKTLFFVYVKVRGVPHECTPCRLDEEITLGVTLDVNMLYQKVMQFTKGISDTCQIPMGFSDFILLWHAFKAAIETEHYIPAIKYFNMMFEDGTYALNESTVSKQDVVAYRGCGCHG